MLDACHVIEQKANECTGDVEVELLSGGGRLARTSAAAETSAGHLH